MKPHDRLDEEARDRVALHAVGALSEREAAEVEAHLAICAPCRAEAASLRRAAEALYAEVPSRPAPPELREKLLARVRGAAEENRPAAQPWKTWSAPAAPGGLLLLRGADGEWEKTAVDGVEVRKLYVDEAADRVTMLVRMAPGTSYPSHRHGGAEECYVLEGDLLVGGTTMRAGDYQRAEGGSRHGIQATETGCLLFIVSSLRDELTV